MTKDRLQELTVGMEVELIPSFSLKGKKGVVAQIEESCKTRFIDGKPVQSRKTLKVIIALDAGSRFELTDRNCSQYIIRNLR